MEDATPYVELARARDAPHYASSESLCSLKISVARMSITFTINSMKKYFLILWVVMITGRFAYAISGSTDVHKEVIGIGAPVGQAPSESNWLLRGRFDDYLGSSNFFISVGLEFDSVKSLSSSLGAGVGFGFELPMSKNLSFEGITLIGAMDRFYSEKTMNLNEPLIAFMAQPSLALDLKLGGGWRVGAISGYTYIPRMPSIDGAFAALTLGHKMETSSRGTD